MAADAQLQSLKEEATCSICLEYFTEPVSVECGHAFCLSCITQCWEGLEANFPCPQCRETSQNKTLRPIRQLGKMVEIAKQLHAPSNTPQEENLCREHEEKLKVFCEDDQRPICLVCSMSRDHKPHTVLPISEAVQGYKDKLYSHMEHLKKELKDLQEWVEEESRKASELEGNIMKQRESILSTFEHLKQFLEKEKQQLLSRLEKEQEEKMKKIQEKLTRLEEQQSTHRDLITELESKCQQQDVDLLKDVKSVLDRCSEVKALNPQEDAAGMETTLQSTTRHAHLQEKLTELKETFPAEMGTFNYWRYVKSCEREYLWFTNPKLCGERGFGVLVINTSGGKIRCGERGFGVLVINTSGGKISVTTCLFLHCLCALSLHPFTSFARQSCKSLSGRESGEVTLDPGTAHPELIVSADRRSVRRGHWAQDLPDTPQRFTIFPCVLGREGLSSGRHYWEVDVGGSTCWTLGVCDESVPRKEKIALSPVRGFWTVKLKDGEYKAFPSPPTLLTPRVPQRVLGLFLDCEAGRLSVYDAQDRALLFTFPGAPFPRTLWPYFRTWSTKGGAADPPRSRSGLRVAEPDNRDSLWPDVSEQNDVRHPAQQNRGLCGQQSEVHLLRHRLVRARLRDLRPALLAGRPVCCGCAVLHHLNRLPGWGSKPAAWRSQGRPQRSHLRPLVTPK
ncbi:E3 ubiquitin-protein ligase TRIM39-like [Ambystoma mexicanum]|uniref:E3 ubiquitin-protein ligase TRIM39-like n=1 Tax=Ambystoma mexicanum TaxID=8296 RepID=UPI0037E863ED